MPLSATVQRLQQLLRKPQLVNAAIYLGFAVLTSIIGFATVMITTRLVAPVEYGLIGVFFSVLFFVAPVVSLSADSLIGVNKVALDLDRYRVFQRAYIAVAYSCYVVVQLLFIAAWFAGVFQTNLLLGAPLFGLVRFLAGMAATEYVVEQHAIAFGIITTATSSFALVLTVALLMGLSPWGGYRVMAMFTADLLMLAIRYRGRLTLLTRPQWHRETARQILAFGLPSMIAVAGGWALNEADKIIVAREAGMHDAGIYAAAAALAAIMMTFNQSLTNALYPEMFRRLAEGRLSERAIVGQYAVRFVAFASAFCAIALGGYFLVADMLLPQRYLGGRAVFIALMLAGITVSFYRPFGLVAEYLRWGRIRAVAISIGGLLAVAVGLLGVRTGELVWAPAGIAVGYVCAALILAARLLRRVDKA